MFLAQSFEIIFLHPAFFRNFFLHKKIIINKLNRLYPSELSPSTFSFIEGKTAMSHRYRILGILSLLLFISAVQLRAQSDTTRLVFVGNSITEGSCTGNAAQDGYPPQLAILLGSKWKVMNAGVSGRTMLKHGDFPIWNENLFKSALAYNPDIVVISLGTNDSKPYNWTDTLKSQFVPDYKSMIDTFKNLPSHPAVWVALPPPAFSGAYDIRDSVIDADIIPMIRQVATDKNCQIIDFNALLQPYSNLIPDGIHPNTMGMTVMAKYLYTIFTGKSSVSVTDENCVRGKPVTVNGSIDAQSYGGANLVDADTATEWTKLGYPAEAAVDLGSERTVDLFRVDFAGKAASNAGYQFRIQTSTDRSTWTTVLDRTTRTDSATTILVITDSIRARYVNIIITGAARPRGDTVSIAEMRVYTANGSAHGLAIAAQRSGGTAKMPRYNIIFQWPEGATGSMMLFRNKNLTGPTAIAGIRKGASYTLAYEYIKPEEYNKYWAVSIRDGVETVSDTVYVGTAPTGIDDKGTGNVPAGYRLEPSYPNPFNPSTNISFTIPRREHVSLKIFDVNGKLVAVMINEGLAAGTYRRQWSPVANASGVYFCTLKAGTYQETKKLVLVK